MPRRDLGTRRLTGRSQTIDFCTDGEKAWVRLREKTHDHHAPLETSADPKASKIDPAMNVAAITVEIAAIGIRFG